jgi:hypothetical protein
MDEPMTDIKIENMEVLSRPLGGDVAYCDVKIGEITLRAVSVTEDIDDRYKVFVKFPLIEYHRERSASVSIKLFERIRNAVFEEYIRQTGDPVVLAPHFSGRRVVSADVTETLRRAGI